MALNSYILLSGGIDSTAALHFSIRNKHNIQCVYIDYGQISRKKELIAVEMITRFYNIPLQIITVKPLSNMQDGYIRGRNLFLASIALISFPFKEGYIVTGIHSDTSYNDCTPSFVNKTQDIFDLYSNGAINFRAPFLSWKKLDIWRYCREHEVPVELTYSCELGKLQPCGVCLSCKDIEKINAFENQQHSPSK